MLREAFGPDATPPDAARDRARVALLDRMAPAAPRRRSRRWVLRAGLTGAVAAAAVVAGVAVENLGSPDGGGPLPFPRPANAAEVLENAAWAAGRKPWRNPRPDQFMYKETQELRNPPEIERDDPNGHLRLDVARNVVRREWHRVDAQIWARTENGRLVIERQGDGAYWSRLDYAELARLTTADKWLAWDRTPRNYGVDLPRIPGQYVLPPAVEAALFRALARRDGVRLNPDAVNIDGRPAIGLGQVLEGYLAEELLFDRETYALIGERLVAVADHTNIDEHGNPDVTRNGELHVQRIYTASAIVDHPGDTR
ncbi:hypothetical protein GCM10007977_082100 [Dactylosporangium sucinum]|uniref:Uncharacterized protein n=2 Tax=Dactylosporangium sucinum TaxID=1424081 RepID=A0A917X407_9ACTN|nr:hypothetical protein GCM10007977_082100 [Dactylosporangium sucinum]